MTTFGVAIAVPDPWGAELQGYRTGLGDDTAHGIPTHVTLLPPFEVQQQSVAAVEQHLKEAAADNPAFAITLRGTGTFRPVSPVVFVTLADGSAGCERLAGALRSGPLVPGQEFPYHPHVTIAHHLPDVLLDRAAADLADFGCEFVVESFALYVHEPGSGWLPMRQFELAAPPRVQGA